MRDVRKVALGDTVSPGYQTATDTRWLADYPAMTSSLNRHTSASLDTARGEIRQRTLSPFLSVNKGAYGLVPGVPEFRCS